MAKIDAIIEVGFTLYQQDLIEGAIIRRANKRHGCHRCKRSIEPRTAYVEFIGETMRTQVGRRYCSRCASTDLVKGVH